MREYWEDRKIFFDSRELRFAVSHVILIVLAGLGVPAYNYFRGLRSLEVISRYAYSFWKQHLTLVLWIAIYGLLVFGISAAIRETNFRHGRYPSPRRRAAARRARKYALFINWASLPLYAVAVMFISQRAWWMVQYSAAGLILLAMVVLHVSANTDVIPRLGKHRFRNISFNIAALAPLSEEVESKLAEFKEARMLGGISLQSGSILNTAKSEVFQGLQKLLGIDDPHRIRLAFNTTSAVRIALEEVKIHCLKREARLPLLITTDADYPAVIKLIQGNAVDVQDKIEEYLKKERLEPRVAEQEGSGGKHRPKSEKPALPEETLTDLERTIRWLSDETYKEALDNFRQRTESAKNKADGDPIENLYQAARGLEPMPQALAYVVPVKQDIIRGPISSEKICERLLRAALAAIKAGRPALIVTSHVHWETGHILDVTEFQRQIKSHNEELHKQHEEKRRKNPATEDDDKSPAGIFKLNDNLFIVLDGAQAVGHIDVVAQVRTIGDQFDFWNGLTYYAGCTHKWLLGKETLGFLIKGKGNEIKGLPADGSMFSFAEEFYSGYGGTISVDSFVGASVSLRDFEELGMEKIVQHNLELVRCFKTALHSIDGLDPREELGSSIVLVRCKDELAERIVRGYEERRGNVVSIVKLRIDHQPANRPLDAQRTSDPEEGFSYLRFCFHYFHSEKDVLDLVEELETIVDKARRYS